VSDVQVDGATTIYTQNFTDAAALVQLSQSFTFHEEAVAGQFAGRGFSIGASTLKWSLTLTSTSVSSGGGSGGRPLTVRYRLSEVMGTSSSSLAANPAGSVTMRRGVPQAQMTTYYVPFLSSVVAYNSSSSSSSPSQLVALVEVWDLAVADGVERPLAHDLRLVADDDDGRSSSSSLPEYVLELRLPNFTSSLYYDPSLSLGMLVGSSGGSARSKSGDGGIDGNTTLLVIAGVVVGVVVLAGIAVASTVTVLVKRRKTKRLQALRKNLMHTTSGLVRALTYSPCI
jgi:hypothetical protein